MVEKKFPIGRFLHLLSKKIGENEKTLENVLNFTRLSSRKHATVLIEGISTCLQTNYHNNEKLVVKYYTEAEIDLLNHEKSVLLKSVDQGVKVPKVIDIMEGYLLLEFIEGENLCDFINENQRPQELKENAIEKLGSWLASFHLAFLGNEGTPYIRGDSMLRNFIVTSYNGREIVGVDFEEATEQPLIIDVGEIIDSVLTTNPSVYIETNLERIRWKFQLVGLFLESYFTYMEEKGRALVDRDLMLFLDQVTGIMCRLAGRRKAISRLMDRLPEIREMLHYEIRSSFIQK